MLEYPLQLIGIAFSLAMLYLTFHSFKRGEFSKNDAILWFLVWVWFSFALFFSSALEQLIQPLRLLSVFDLILVSAVGILLVMVHKMYKDLKKLQHKLDALVRKLALQDVE